jgi:hypothetical protein
MERRVGWNVSLTYNAIILPRYGATRDRSTKETSNLKILLIFCGIKRLTKPIDT